MASAVSTIAMINVSRFKSSEVSLTGCGANPNCGIPPNTERSPAGGKRSFETNILASSAVLICGMTRPSAPLSNNRVAMLNSPFGTRAIGVSPACNAVIAI